MSAGRGPLRATRRGPRIAIVGFVALATVALPAAWAGSAAAAGKPRVVSSTLNYLAPGDELDAGMSLVSLNGQFNLEMQADGNLVEYTSGGTAIWATGTSATNPVGAYAVMQADGNLVMYDGLGNILFATNTEGQAGAYLALGDFGQLSVNSPSGVQIWEPWTVVPGTTIPAGTTVRLPGGQSTLVMQTDGNLVQYGSDGAAVWASGTSTPGSYAVMQGDGNFVVYSSGGTALWATGTSGNAGAFVTLGELGQVLVESATGTPLWGQGFLTPGSELRPGTTMALPGNRFFLVMQGDGNLVEYMSGGVVAWASGTNTPGSFAVMQGDGNLVVYSNAGKALWASNTEGNPGAYVALNEVGQLVVDSTSGGPLWGPGLVLSSPPGALAPNVELRPGQSLMSVALPVGLQFQLLMQGDGNLVEYTPAGAPVWASGTSGAGSFAAMQGDGNLVVYTGAGKASWASNTPGNPGSVLAMGQFGQLVVRSSSGASLWSSPLEPPGLPTAPSSVNAVGGNGTVADATAIVSWSPPQASVATPVSQYEIVASPGGATEFVPVSTTSVSFGGLTDGKSYAFEVFALNSAGTGAGSWPLSDPVTPRAQPTTPGPTKGIEAVPGDAEVTASWSAPVDDGGSSITGYVVSVSPGSYTVSVGASQTTAEIAGLTDGTSYTVTVAATNGLGTGKPFSSAPAVPAATPFPSGATVVSDGDPNDWSRYNYDASASDWNTSESNISAEDAANMSAVASASGLGYVQSSMPVVAFGRAFVGSQTGYENSFLTGSLKAQWSTYLGTDGPLETCPGTFQYGVVSAPTMATVGGTDVAYLSGGDASLYALNALTGAILWRTQLAAPPNDFSFVSPLLYDGALYTGIASYGDCPLVQGRFFKINPLTGAIESTFLMAPNGCVGGGLWGSPSVDSSGHIFFATATEVEGCTGTAEGVQGWQLETSVVEVDADLDLVSYWHLPEAQQISDSDFGAVPTIYDDAGATGSGEVVAIPNKNGTVYAFDRQNLSAGPIWKTAIAVGGSNPAIDGSISPMAYDGTRLYVAGGATTISGQACGASVRALNPSNGALEWSRCFAQGPSIGPVTGANGVVVACVDNSVYVLDASNGATLFTYPMPGDSPSYSGASISNGSIFADNSGGNVVQLSPGA